MDKYQHILIAVDGSDESEKAFQEGVAIAKRNQAVLNVLFVIDTVPNSYYWGNFALDAHKLYEEIEATTVKKLDEKVTSAKNSGVKEVVPHIVYGDPKHIIAEFSEKFDIPVDLIVIGATGKNRVERVLVGSTTAYVVNHAKCNVMVVK